MKKAFAFVLLVGCGDGLPDKDFGYECRSYDSNYSHSVIFCGGREPENVEDVFVTCNVRKSRQEQFEGCSVIIIAHRLETVISCDNIIVMGSGAVIEEGSPVDLLTKNDGNGAFKMLVEATGKSYEELLSI